MSPTPHQNTLQKQSSAPSTLLNSQALMPPSFTTSVFCQNQSRGAHIPLHNWAGLDDFSAQSQHCPSWPHAANEGEYTDSHTHGQANRYLDHLAPVSRCKPQEVPLAGFALLDESYIMIVKHRNVEVTEPDETLVMRPCVCCKSCIRLTVHPQCALVDEQNREASKRAVHGRMQHNWHGSHRKRFPGADAVESSPGNNDSQDALDA